MCELCKEDYTLGLQIHLKHSIISDWLVQMCKYSELKNYNTTIFHFMKNPLLYGLMKLLFPLQVESSLLY